MERDPSLATTGFSMVEQIRNSRAGMFVTAAVASLSMTSAIGAGELAFANPVAADQTPPTQVQPGSQEQACIQEGLAFPTYYDVKMVDPGHKPLNQQDLPYAQAINGKFNYPAAPDCVSIDYIRIAGGQLQQQSNHIPRIWVNIPNHFKWNPAFIGDNGGPSQLGYGPPHAYPAWLFDERIPGKGYGKVRDKLFELVRDEALPGYPIVAESHETIRIPVIVKSVKH